MKTKKRVRCSSFDFSLSYLRVDLGQRHGVGETGHKGEGDECERSSRGAEP